MATTTTDQLTAAQIAQIVALVQAQAKLRAQLTATAVAAATTPLAAFSSLAAWFSSSQSQAYITRALKIIRPAQVSMARTTDAYHARVLSIMTGKRVDPVGAVDVTALRRAITPAQAQQIVDALPADYSFAPSQPTVATVTQSSPTRTTPAPASVAAATTPGRPRTNAVPAATTAAPATSVDPAQVYGRIFDQARYNIVARGLTLEKVRSAAVSRAAHVAATDIMLADRAQSRQTMRTRGVQRYRRVIRPYAGKGGPVCGLCVVASDRIYSIEDLLPIHDNCRCETVPVGSAGDPGKTLNDQDLKDLYAAAGGTGAGGLLRVQVAISEHGELGPILSYGNQNRRGITEVAASSGVDRAATAAAQLASYEKSIVALRDRAAAGEDLDKAIAFQTAKIDQLRAELQPAG